MIAFEDKMRQGGDAAIRQIDQFFAGTDPVHATMDALVTHLKEWRIEYAVAGGLAVFAHGLRRTTVNVDVLVSGEGNWALARQLAKMGYAFVQSNQWRDIETGVRIEFLITGEFPGDGKPKPVAFPDPAEVGVEIDGIRYLKLEKLIELKLASGMTNPNRLRDLADVQELIRALRPERKLGEQLHEFVRVKFYELWDGLAGESRTEA